jgi:hypothetical protein
MKISITGHTFGLGEEIYNHLSSLGHEVIGMSRSNGYNLPDDISKIIEVAKTCDIFFNNVHQGISQATLIEKLYNTTSVVTSGSMAGDYWMYNSVNIPQPYSKEKFQIERTHKKFKKMTQNPMLLLKMGHLTNSKGSTTIPYEYILNAIDFWLITPRASIIEFDNINYDELQKLSASV